MTAISEPKGKVLCLPAKAIRDELGVDILAQFLINESFDVHHTARLNVGEALELVEKEIRMQFALESSLHLSCPIQVFFVLSPSTKTPITHCDWSMGILGGTL